MSVAILPGVFTIPQAAKHVGVTAKTLRKEIKAGHIPVRYIGRCVRILDEDLGAWLRANRSSAGRAASTPDAESSTSTPKLPAGGELDQAVAS